MKKNKPQVEVYRCEKCKFQSSFIPGQQIVKKCKVCGSEMTLYYTRDYNPQNGLNAIKDSNSHTINKQQFQSQSNIPKCPTCGSTNISKIGTFNRMLSTGLFGLASGKIGKTMKCRNCGMTW